MLTRIKLTAVLGLMGLASLGAVFFATNSYAQTSIASPSIQQVDNGSDPESTRPTFTWSEVSSATYYAIELCKIAISSSTTACTGSNLIQSASNIRSISWTPVSDIPNATRVYWRVRAYVTGYGFGPFSQAGTFLSAAAPLIPSTQYAMNPVLQTTLRPTFKWTSAKTATSINPGSFDIEVAKDTAFTQDVRKYSNLLRSTYCTPASPLPSGTTTYTCNYTISSSLPELDPGSTYYWRVRSRVGGGGLNDDASWWKGNPSFKTYIKEAPTLNSPANAAILKEYTPTLSWSTVPGATRYNLQFCKVNFTGTNGACPSGQAISISGASNVAYNSFVTSSLASYANTSTTIYWKVQGSSVSNGLGPWSAIPTRYFKVEAGAPNQTTLTAFSPAIQLTSRPGFNWRSTDTATTVDPHRYELEVGLDAKFTSIVGRNTFNASGCAVTGTTTKTYTCTDQKINFDLSPLTNYYWRVRAVSEAGVSSPWVVSSSSMLVKIGLINSPGLDNVDTTSTNPTFSWSTVSGAIRYNIQLCKQQFPNTGNCPSAFTIAGGSNLTTNSWTPTTALPAGQQIYWRVQGVSQSYGVGVWSAANSFTAASAPNVPSAQVAFNPLIQTTLRPTFKWTSTKTATSVNPESFDIEVATDSGYTQEVKTFTAQRAGNCTPATPNATGTTTYTCAYTINSDLLPGAGYYWRVRSVSASGDTSKWLGAAAIRLRTYIQSAPTLNSPANAAIIKEYTPTLSWSTVPGATRYNLQFCKVNFTGTNGACPSGQAISVSGASNVPTNSFVTSSLTAHANNGTTIYWKVQGSSVSNGLGPWSAIPTRYFKVEAGAPNTPKLYPFSPAIQLTPRPGFKWSSTDTAATVDPNKYELELALDSKFTNIVGTKNTFNASGCAVTGNTTKTYTCTDQKINFDLSPLTNYYWRVRAVSEAGVSSPWVVSSSSMLVKIGLISGPDTGVPTVEVSLSASPNAIRTNENTTLTATVTGGTATGSIKYEFRCNNTDSYTDTGSTTNTTKTYTCGSTYTSARTYYPQVRVTRETAVSESVSTESPVIVSLAPTVAISTLSATPASGDAPLTASTTATVTGTATGNMTFQFDCNNDGTFEVTRSNITSTPYTASSICNYTSGGTYTLASKVTRDGVTSDVKTTTVQVNFTGPAPRAMPDTYPSPATDAKKLNVLVVRYRPEGADASRTTHMNEITAEWEKQFERASREHGYLDPSGTLTSSKPIIDVVVKGTIDRYTQVPNAGESWASLGQMLTTNNNEICSLINSQLLDMVWITFTPEAVTGASGVWSNEFNHYLNENYPNAANNPCGNAVGTTRSFAIMAMPSGYLSNGQGGVIEQPAKDVSLHVFGHFMESLMSLVQNNALFVDKFAGVTYATDGVTMRLGALNKIICGNMHWAPFATTTSDDYDYNLTKTASNNVCENWDPTLSGQTSDITRFNWGCSDAECRPQWYERWWFNNMPGRYTAINYDPDGSGAISAKRIPAWFEFISGQNEAIEYYTRRRHTWWINNNWVKANMPGISQFPEYVANQSMNARADGSTLSWSHTNTGTDKLLLVTVGYGHTSGGGSVASVTYTPSGGSALSLTRIRQDVPADGKATEIWYLKNPSGTGTITVNFSGTVWDSAGVAQTYVGINQTTPFVQTGAGDGLSTSPGGARSHTLNIPSVTKSVVHAVYYSYSGSNGVTPVGDTLEVANQTTGGGVMFSGSRPAISGASSTPIQWQNTNEWFWSASGIALQLK